MAIPDVSDKSLSDLVSLQGKVAVVTGGTKGIGLGISQRLAEAGAIVLVAGRDQASADEAATTIAYGKVIGAQVDAGDAASLVALCDRAVNEFGRLDVWVNNAGIFPFKPTLEVSDQEWQQVLDVDLSGVFIGSREAARRMIASGQGGVIINISSLAGLRGTPNSAAYIAAKHGVEGLTKSLATEFAPMSIRVLSVAPTFIKTPGTEAMSNASAMEEQMVNRIPVGRAGVPDDIARAVLFCACDLSLFMTGSTLYLDGGQMAMV